MGRKGRRELARLHAPADPSVTLVQGFLFLSPGHHFLFLTMKVIVKDLPCRNASGKLNVTTVLPFYLISRSLEL